MRKTNLIVCLSLVVLFFVVPVLPVLAQDDPAANPGSVPIITGEQHQQKPSRPGSLPERVGPGIYRIGQVQLDKTKRSLTVPARVNMESGLLEYVLVRNGGKTHESLFLTDAEPYDIQLACLLLNMEGTAKPLPYQGAPMVPTGEPLKLSVALRDEQGRTHHYQPEAWIKKVISEKKQDVKPLDWVFTGSLINHGHFAAQMEGSIIALYHDPAAIIDNASPGGENDEIWFVNDGAVPPVGTPVVLTIQIAQ